MALVPSGVQPISMDVASAYVPDNPTLGRTSQAIGAVGSNIAQQSLGMLEQVKKAEAVDASSSAVFQDRYDSEDQIAKLKLQYPDGYITDSNGQRVKNTEDQTDRTITQEYRDWANKRYQDRQQNMPTQLAQQMYVQRAGELYSDSIQKVRNDELVLRTESFKRNMGSDLTTGLNKLTDAPTTSNAYALMQNLADRTESQKGILLSAQQVYDVHKNVQKEIPQSLFAGKINQALATPKEQTTQLPNGQIVSTRSLIIKEGMDILNGNDSDSIRRQNAGLPTIASTMDPDQKAQFEQKFIRLSQITEKLDRSDLELKTRDAHAALRLGEPVQIQPIIDGWKAELTAKKISPYEYADKIGGLVALNATMPTYTDPTFLLSSPEKKSKIIDAAANTAQQAFFSQLPPEEKAKFEQTGASQREGLVKMLFAKADEADNLARSDFVSFAQFDKGVQRSTAQLDLSAPSTLLKTGGFLKERTDRLYALGNSYFGGNSQDFRILSKEESQQLGNFLTNEKTGYQDAARGLQALRQSVGDSYYATMVDQMIKDKSLGGEWRLVMSNPRPSMVQDFIQTVRDDGHIRGDTKKMGLNPEDFDTAVQKQAGEILAGMTQAAGDSAMAADQQRVIRDVIANKAMALSKQSLGSVKPDQAVQMATDAFLKTQYKSVAVGGGWFSGVGSRSSMLLPSWVTPDQQNFAVSNRASILRTEDGLKSVGVLPPPGMKPEEAPVFYKNVTDEGRMVQTPDHNGYYIQYFDKTNNRWQSTFTGKTDRNGKAIPVIVPLQRLIQKPDEAKAPGFWDNMVHSLQMGGGKQ